MVLVGCIASPNAPNEYWPTIVSIGTPCAIAVVVAPRPEALVRVTAEMMICTAAYANAAPPPGWRVQDPGTLRKAVSGKPLEGSVRVEVVDVGSDIKLLVPARDSKGDDEE